MQASTHCLNCQYPLQAHDHYCAQCGQQSVVHRLGWHDVSHGLFHYFIHADKSLLGLIKGLATQPGQVAHDFISGRRKHWFNPYTFFLLCVSVIVFGYVAFHSMEVAVAQPDPGALAKFNAEQKAIYLGYFRRQAQVQYFSNRYLNLINMFSVPVTGFIIWLGNRKRGLNYFETVTAQMYFRGFTAITISLLIAPLLGAFKDQMGFYFSFIVISQLLTIIYMTWGFTQLVRKTGVRPVAGWKMFLLVFAAQMFWMIFSMGLFSVYIWQTFFTF